MSITDELRHEVAGYPFRDNRDFALFEAIADRIDAEHERVRAESIIDMADESMAEHGWVRLPKDADGVPIRFGDKVTVSWSEKVYEVRGFSYTEQLAGGERIIWVDVYSLEKMRNIPLCGASSCHHYHAPTVEDVLDEIVDKANSIGCAYASNDMSGDEMMDALKAIVAEYAKRLKLAGEDE